MHNDISVIIIDNDTSYAAKLAAYINVGRDTNFFGSNGVLLNSFGGEYRMVYTDDFNSGLDMIQTANPAAVILNVALDGVDFDKLAAALDGMGKARPPVIACADDDAALYGNAAFAGVCDRFFIKNHPLEDVGAVIRGVLRTDTARCNKQADGADYCGDGEFIERYITRLGVPRNYRGYRYLKCALELVIDDFGMADAVTTKLYPAIAERFHVTAAQVERGIRSAIAASWQRGDKALLKGIFGYTSDDRGISAPTNAEYIAMTADDANIRMKHKTAV